MPKADNLRLQIDECLDGSPVLRHVDRENGWRFPKARLSGQETQVSQHIARNAESVGISKEHAVTRRVAGSVDHSKASNFIAVFQNPPDRTTWPRPYPFTEANHPVAGYHTYSSLRGRHIVSVTSQGNMELVAYYFRRPLVVGMAVRQCDHAQRSALELPKEAAGAPPSCCIDQHIAKQVDVEVMCGKT